jgi:hypothetical protein
VEPLIWRVRVGDGQRSRLVVVWLVAVLAGVVGFVLFHSILTAALGFVIIAGSTSEYWWGVRYRLDEIGATSQNGPSVSKIAWTDVRRLIVNDSGVTLSPLATDSRLTPFRGVFLRPGPMGANGLLEKIQEFGGEDVQRLV